MNRDTSRFYFHFNSTHCGLVSISLDQAMASDVLLVNQLVLHVPQVLLSKLRDQRGLLLDVLQVVVVDRVVEHLQVHQLVLQGKHEKELLQ